MSNFFGSLQSWRPHRNKWFASQITDEIRSVWKHRCLACHQPMKEPGYCSAKCMNAMADTIPGPKCKWCGCDVEAKGFCSKECAGDYQADFEENYCGCNNELVTDEEQRDRVCRDCK